MMKNSEEFCVWLVLIVIALGLAWALIPAIVPVISVLSAFLLFVILLYNSILKRKKVKLLIRLFYFVIPFLLAYIFFMADFSAIEKFVSSIGIIILAITIFSYSSN